MNWQKVLYWVYVGLASIPLLFCLCVVASHPAVMHYLIFPSTHTIAQRYITAVTAGDLDAAAALADPGDKLCHERMRQAAERHIVLFEDAEIRELETRIGINTYSDESLEVATMTFEYRLSVDSVWQKGELMLWTDYFVRRYACGCSIELDGTQSTEYVGWLERM